MSYEFFIAKRYFRSKRRTGFISLINYFSIAGVMIGVAALVIVLSVMNGFETEVRSRIIGFDSHIRFRSFHDRGLQNFQSIQDDLKKYEHVAAISPYIYKNTIILYVYRNYAPMVSLIIVISIIMVSVITLHMNYPFLQKIIPGSCPGSLSRSLSLSSS